MNNEIEKLQDDLDNLKKLDVIADSEGGKVLIETLTKDIVSSIDSLCSNFQTASHIELIAVIAKIKERLNIIRVLTRAKENKEFLSKEIKEMLVNEIAQ